MHYCAESSEHLTSSLFGRLLIERVTELFKLVTSHASRPASTTSGTAAQTSQAPVSTSSTSSFVDDKDAEGLTALALAVVAGNAHLVDTLVRLGADVRCTDHKGHTVIHFATGKNESDRERERERERGLNTIKTFISQTDSNK